MNSNLTEIKDVLKRNNCPNWDSVQSCDDVKIRKHVGLPSPDGRLARENALRAASNDEVGCVIDVLEGLHRTEGWSGGCNKSDEMILRKNGVQEVTRG